MTYDSLASLESTLGEPPLGHGTNKRPSGGCNRTRPICGWCFVRTRRVNKHAAMRRERGLGKVLVPAKPSTDIIRRLQKQYGFSQAAIAREVGTTTTTIHKLRHGYHDKVEQDIATGLEKMLTRRSARDMVYKNHVPADRARRIVRGLMAQGFSQPWIGEQCGYSRNAVMNVNSTIERISMDFETKLLELAHRVGHTGVGPSTKARNIARERGYFPLAEWDDI